MIRKNISLWYRALPIAIQLCISFGLNIVFWFGISLSMNLFWQQDKPMQYFAFRALFIALLWTILFNWIKVRSVFRKDNA